MRTISTHGAVGQALRLVIDPEAALAAGHHARKLAWGVLMTERGRVMRQRRPHHPDAPVPGDAA